MAGGKTISLNIDVAGQDELLQATKRVNALTKEKRNLNKALKEGRISQDGYDKAIMKNNVNLSVARRRTNELNRELVKKSKILKDSRSFTQKLSGSFMKMGVQIGLAVGAFKALTSAVSGSIEAYGKQAEAETRLLTATQGNVAMTDNLIQKAQELQQVSTYGDEEIIAQQAYLASLGMTEKQINEVITASMDLAVGTGQTLEFGVKNLAKTFGGLTGELGESLPMLKNLTKEQLMAGEAVDVVAEAFRGQAEAVALSGTGPLQQFQNVFGDIKEKGGEVLMEFITPFINKLVKWMPKIPGFFRNMTRGLFDFLNYFVDLYNESMGFRAIIESIKLNFTNLKTVAVNAIRLIGDSLGSIGKMIRGVFTLDPELAKEGFVEYRKTFVDGVKNTAKEMKDNLEVALSNIKTGTIKKLSLSDDEAEKITKSYAGVIKKTNKVIKKATKTDPFKTDLQALKENQTKALNIIKQNYVDGIIKSKEDYDKQILDAELLNLNAMKLLYEQYGKDIGTIDKAILDKKIANMKKEKEEYKAVDASKLEISSAGVSMLGEISDRQTVRQMESLEAQKEAGIISEEQFVQQKEDIERKAFNRKKKLDIAEVIINFATANSKTFAKLGFPAGLVAIPGLTGLMLAQIGMIAGQQFADGGLVGGGMFDGPSHAQGGIKFASGGRIMEAEGGEAIINKRSTSMFKPLLSSINSAGGGVKFADGGILNGFKDNFQMMGQYGGNRSDVIVVESNITSTQNTVKNIQSTASI